MDITQVLTNAQSPDGNVRQHAEQTIRQAQEANLPLFLVTLTNELANEEKPPEARRLAGIIIKNSMKAKDTQRQKELAQGWLQTDPQMKQQIKYGVMTALGSAAPQARHAAAQVVATVAAIELPAGQWEDLVDILLRNVTASQSDYLKQATLEAIGYICEEIDPAVLALKANQILTAVVQGMRKEEPNQEVRKAATIALNNALEFVKTNFENEQERNVIMQTVCEAAIADSQAIRIASYECMVKIASLYYSKLAPYIQTLFQLTMAEIKEGTDEVAQQAVEFWSTICDEEIEINEDMEEARQTGESPEVISQQFVKGVMPYLVPLLLETLKKQDEDDDEDTWNVAMAAGTCLALIAQACKDDVVPAVMQFVQSNIQGDWRQREAATLAFGSILEGPSKETIQPLVLQAVPIMMALARDPSVQVRDTAAWTIGRICDIHPETLAQGAQGGSYLTELLKPGGVLLESLKDMPRVASNVCWAIHNLAESVSTDAEASSSALSPFFIHMVQALIVCAERPDADQNNLRAASYEALNTVLAQSAQDTMNNVREIVPFLADKLEKTFSMQIVSNDDRETQNELQGLLCGTLQVVIQKLGSHVQPFADKLMQLFYEVFNSKNSTVHEEALMAVGAIANGVEKGFEAYMPTFRQYLIHGLQNAEAHQVVQVAVGVVGDLCRALEKGIFPYCDEIVSLLMTNLQNPNLNRNVKPPMLSVFGDIALAVGANFDKYLPVTMQMLTTAAQTQVDTSNYEMVDYLNQLREGILDAYTGILQGLREDKKGELFAPYIEPVVSFLMVVAVDVDRDDSVTRSAVGVIGDLAHTLGAHAKAGLSQEPIKALLRESRKSDNPQTKQVAAWAHTTVKQVLDG